MKTRKYKNLLNPYKYKTPDICRALGVKRLTLYRWEQLGIFTPPRNHRGDRVVTQKQIREIVEAFSPSGKNEWHFNVDKE